MSASFFHGARVTESADGLSPIQPVSTSVIGIVGTAPDSATAASAVLTLGTVVANNALTFTAKNAGALGKQISVAFRNPAANSQALSVAVTGRAIVVSLATGSTGTVTTTAAQVLAAITADANASALVTIAETGASTGAGIVTPTTSQFLSGGADEAFPLNTPVLIAANQTQAARAGTAGTLPAAFADIFAQCGAVIVAIRVAEGMTPEATAANVIGGIDEDGRRTGIQALMDAQSILGVNPKLLIAPEFTSDQGVLSAFLVVAESLRGHIIAEGPDTNDADALTYSQNFGSRRVFLIDPGIKKMNNTGDVVIRPNSASVAGLVVRTDNANGFHWSPSNQEIYAIEGTTRPIRWRQGDPTSEANILNSQNIATIIRRNGYRLWGNRTLSADPRFAFLCVSRVADALAELVEATEQYRVDGPMTPTRMQDIAEEVNDALRVWKNLGIIMGGKCWPDPDLNTAANSSAGKFYWNFDWGAVYPGEDLEFKQMLVTTYLADLLK